MPRPTFTLPDLAAVAEVEYRTLHTWLKRGMLRASIAPSTGAGTTNYFAYADALEARVLADLRRAGLDVAMLEHAARGLQATDSRLRGSEVVLVNGSVRVLTEPEPADLAEIGRQPTVVYAVASADRAVRQHIETD